MRSLYWFGAFILVFILALCIYLNLYDTKTLSDCSRTTKAYLRDIHQTRKKGYTFVYRYKVDDKTYENNEWIMDNNVIKAYSVGDSILIDYGCDDYGVSKTRL